MISDLAGARKELQKALKVFEVLQAVDHLVAELEPLTNACRETEERLHQLKAREESAQSKMKEIDDQVADKKAALDRLVSDIAKRERDAIAKAEQIVTEAQEQAVEVAKQASDEALRITDKAANDLVDANIALGKAKSELGSIESQIDAQKDQLNAIAAEYAAAKAFIDQVRSLKATA